MTISPMVAGLAIGALGVMATILVANYLMKRMQRRYEMCLRARDTRIELLLKRIDDMEKRNNRREVFRQIERPLG